MRTRQLAIHAVLVSGALLTFYPFVFMITTSLKSNEQFLHQFWGITFPIHWDNYTPAWNGIRQYIVNSVYVSVLSVGGVLVVSCMSAYAFARHRFPGDTMIFYSILSLMMVPGVLTLISSFMWMKQFPLVGGNDWTGQGGSGFLNSHMALILPYIAGGQVFAILILRSFLANLPEDIFEAARLDGAGELRILTQIAVPLSKPILSAIAIMNLLSVWNDYVWPLIVISDDAKRTLPIGLAFFRGVHGTTYGPLMAGYILASLPLLLLFFFAMRSFVTGLTSGAIKA